MRIFSIISRFNQMFTMLFFTALIIVVVLQILSRFTPMSFMWTEELSRFLFIFAIAFGAPVAMEKREYVRVDILIGLLPNKVIKYYDAVIYLIIGAFSSYLIYYAYEFALIGSNRTSATLSIKMSFINASMIVAFALLAIYSFLNVYHLIKETDTQEGGEQT